MAQLLALIYKTVQSIPPPQVGELRWEFTIASCSKYYTIAITLHSKDSSPPPPPPPPPPRLNTVRQTTIPLGSVMLYYMMYEYPNHIGFIVSLFNSKHYHFDITAAPFLFYSIRNFSPKILDIFIISKSFYNTTLTVLTRAQYSREIPDALPVCTHW